MNTQKRIKKSEVYSGDYIISNENIFARTSQCVALGITHPSKTGGIVHLHYRNDQEKLLDEFFDKFSKYSDPKMSKISLAGGCDAFVEYLGMIPGEKNLEQVQKYLQKNNLEKNITMQDIKDDHVRKLTVYAPEMYMNILRL